MAKEKEGHPIAEPGVMKEQLAVVMTCCKNEEEANHIAELLVGEKLAACVNLAPVRSVYRWKGRIVKEGEQLLLIKTRACLATQLQQRIKEVHSYEVAEIVHLNATEVEQSYLAWLLEETRS